MFFNNAAFCNVLSVNRVNTETLIYRLKNPHWWIFPNRDENKYSKVFARVNCAGYLVVGQDMDTRIVCIKDGVLTLSDHGCSEAVRLDDPRLFVFLSSKQEV